MSEIKQIHILGVGSPFGADQVGWQLVDALQASPLKLPESFSAIFEKLDRPGAGLVRYFETGKPTVIIDAMASGAPLGSLRSWREGDPLPDVELLSSHGFGVCQAVELARALGALPNALLIIGIEINPETDEVLMPDLEVVTEQIETFLASIL